MESPILRARELRRHDLLAEAARHRLMASATGSNDHHRVPPVWSSRVVAFADVLGNLAARFHLTPRSPVTGAALCRR